MLSVDALRVIVRKPGFLHTLATILANETIFSSEHDLKTRNRFDLISFHEIALILSLLSEEPLDTSFIQTQEIESQYNACKLELDSLHLQISNLSKPNEIGSLFTEGRHFIEPIFYAASSAFWFDYLELAPKLYELDRKFLAEEGFYLDSFARILKKMHSIFGQRFRDYIRTGRKSIRRGQGVSSALSCFLFSPTDFDEADAVDYLKLIERFSVIAGRAPRVTNPLSYHPAKARPALKLSDTQMFVPVVPMLCEQLFESPFYSIVENKDYFSINANNRGLTSEDILATILSSVSNLTILKDIRLYRNEVVVDQIDLAAVFGATAILFEVKTKRLTEASKNGETEKLLADIRLGILDAQRQLETSKSIILSQQYDASTCEVGDSASLANVRQIVCVSVMTHEIPMYPLLIRTILQTERIEEIIAVSIFDLKMIAHYLNNAFDFLYYFAVRTLLDKSLLYSTEQSLLAFHLKSRLSISETVNMIYVDDGIGQHIDADYGSKDRNRKLKLAFNIDTVDDLVVQITNAGDPSLFRLFSVFRGMSGTSATQIRKIIRQLDRLLLDDQGAHDGTIIFGKVALTFILGNSHRLAQTRCDFLMKKRDSEKKFEQEYMMLLVPKHPNEHRKRPSRLSAGFDVVAIFMKQRNTKDTSLLAFSPYLPKDQWDELEP